MEVYCGPIKTIFVYRMSSMIRGGANIMNELMRQALFDLCALLRSKGLRMPRTLWLQFDNCGENKNKEMIGYMSLLVEGFFFDAVEMTFLIVGHTHAMRHEDRRGGGSDNGGVCIVGGALVVRALRATCSRSSWYDGRRHGHAKEMIWLIRVG
jgi:hypothetical protein